MPLRPQFYAFTFAAVLLPTAAQAQTVFIAEPVQLYAGPAPDYPILMTLAPGMEAQLFGCLPDYQWCDVRLSFGARGWVFAGSLYYPWMGGSVPIIQYGPSLGIPLISFIIGDYWGTHYRHQPWYGERNRWRERPPPAAPMYPPRAMPPPGGWSQPYPAPRFDHDRERERERDKGWEREQGRREREADRERNHQPPRPEVIPPQQPPHNAMPAPNPGWSGGNMPRAQPRPEQAVPRQDQPRAFAPQPARPEPQRDSGPPPRQERGPEHNRGPRPEGPREEHQGNR